MRVRGIGSRPCRYLLVGDWPQRDDARRGRVFDGRVGTELDRYLDGVRIPARDAWYLTTLIKDWQESGEYGPADFQKDEHEFRGELALVQPELVVTLGRNSARWFLGDVDMEDCVGIPWIVDPSERIPELTTPIVVLPIYSLAGAFRNPEMSAQVTYGFGQLAAYMREEIPARRLFDDPYPEPDYRELTSESDTLDVLVRVPTGVDVGCDTEGWTHRPHCVQFAAEPGTAYMIGALQAHAIALWRDWLLAADARLVFHAALHDLAVLRSLGVDVIGLGIPFDDTSIMTYNLQLEPLGLKPLAVRHLGMQMQSYDDVIGDARDRLTLDHMFALLELEEWDLQQRQEAEFIRLTATPYVDARGKLQPGRKLKVHPKLPKSDLHKAVERVLRAKEPWKLWSNQVIDRHVDAEARLGELHEPGLDVVAPDLARQYACRDADATLRLAPILRARITAMGLDQVYQNDLGTVPLIDRMMQVGIKPDLAHFAQLGADLDVEIARVLEEIRTTIVQPRFNPNSGDQVAELLYGQYGLDVAKRTGNGERGSTNDKILEGLEEARPDLPVIGAIRQYREYYKLRHTFVSKIPDYVTRYPFDGRIHATFRITRVVSGRLAASDPNILAQPKHGKFAKRFQAGFVADAGRVIGSWDLNQIELRVLAHLSQDPVMLDSYRRGEDLHAKLAQRIFGVAPKDQDDSKHRLPAKAINFGIPMGMTEHGLTIELRKNGLDVTVDDAKRWLDETLDLYKGVKAFQEFKKAEARRYGYVRDLCGRLRYIGGIRSFDEYAREEAGRFAFSTPIQAGAQEIVKVAEKHIWESVIRPLQDDGYWIEPIVQIHDDIKLEFDPRILPEVHAGMVWAMTQTFDGLSLPIKTKGTLGTSWQAVTDIELKDGTLADACALVQ